MSTKILVGDSRETLKRLPDQSVHCVVTSPPYWALRAYHGNTGMIGMEPTFAEHVENLMEVFDEVWRVLRDDGSFWLNYGDGYAGTKGAPPGSALQAGNKGSVSYDDSHLTMPLKPKNLLMMPSRIAITMQDKGWYLRSENIWAKKNCTPESCKDRPTKSHEKIFQFTKKPRYFYDHLAVQTDAAECTIERHKRGMGLTHEKAEGASVSLHERWHNDEFTHDVKKANMRTVWTLAVASFKEPHFATFPTGLVEPCVKSSTSEYGVCSECGTPYYKDLKQMVKKTPTMKVDAAGRKQDAASSTEVSAPPDNCHSTVSKADIWKAGCDCDADIVPATVLDPFGGAGTVSVVSESLGRDSVICEISSEYAHIAAKRIHRMKPLFSELTIE